MENKIQVQDHSQEILSVIRSNASPGILRNKLEDYHENDLADIFPELTLAERRKICRILDTNMLSDIFEHIDQKQAAEYLDEMDIKKSCFYPFCHGNRLCCGCIKNDSQGKTCPSYRTAG